MCCRALPGSLIVAIMGRYAFALRFTRVCICTFTFLKRKCRVQPYFIRLNFCLKKFRLVIYASSISQRNSVFLLTICFLGPRTDLFHFCRTSVLGAFNLGEHQCEHQNLISFKCLNTTCINSNNDVHFVQ